jgi:hypothetical protein
MLNQGYQLYVLVSSTARHHNLRVEFCSPQPSLVSGTPYAIVLTVAEPEMRFHGWDGSSHDSYPGDRLRMKPALAEDNMILPSVHSS